MNSTEILEGNKLIAEFLNQKLPSNSNFDVYLYHSSWDWIMPVIDKIESLGFYSKISGCATSICHYCWFDDGEDNKDIVIGYNSKTDESKINTVFIACINFIVKYNNNFIK